MYSLPTQLTTEGHGPKMHEGSKLGKLRESMSLFLSQEMDSRMLHLLAIHSELPRKIKTRCFHGKV